MWRFIVQGDQHPSTSTDPEKGDLTINPSGDDGYEQGGISSANFRERAKGRRAFPGPQFIRTAGWWLSGLAGRIANLFAGELDQRRGFLWAPVLIGIGIGFYFSLPREPLGFAIYGVTLIVGGFAILRRWRGQTTGILTVCACLLLGMSLAKMRVERLGAPMLARSVTTMVTGRVASADIRSGRRPRVVLDDISVERLAVAGTPARIRISFGGQQAMPDIGDTITLRARIGPVPGPAAPGDYDPRRSAYFDGLGGSGFALGRWQVNDQQTGNWRAGAQAKVAIDKVRSAIVARLLAALPGDGGAVAAALLVGERGHLPETVIADLRNAGLAHLLAISGLHMGLVAGAMFAAMRGMFALSATLTLTHPIRKWAAVGALVTGFVYLLISGGNVATIRAFVMAAILFGAILVDRPALSLRNLAIAAILVLLMAPESVAEPGFQMSFAAAAALIAVWENWHRRAHDRLAKQAEEIRRGIVGGAGRTIGRALFAIFLTTVIASLATAPMAAFHFQRLAAYSLIGNMLAMPVVSLIVMPFGLMALLLMPFGLEALPLAVFGTGADAVMQIAAFTADLPKAVAQVAALPSTFIVLSLIGLMWLCLWQSRIRYMAVLPIGAAVLVGALGQSPPDIFVNGTGTIIGVRTDDGRIVLSGGRRGSYVADRWHRRLGLEVPDKLNRAGVSCDRLGCIVIHSLVKSGANPVVIQNDRLAHSGAADKRALSNAPGEVLAGEELIVAHVRDPLAFFEDCRRADIIVTPLLAPQWCQSRLVIDKKNLDTGGAQTVTLDGGHKRLTVKSTYPAVRRPWHGPVAR